MWQPAKLCADRDADHLTDSTSNQAVKRRTRRQTIDIAFTAFAMIHTCMIVCIHLSIVRPCAYESNMGLSFYYYYAKIELLDSKTNI